MESFNVEQFVSTLLYVNDFSGHKNIIGWIWNSFISGFFCALGRFLHDFVILNR